MSSIAAAQFLPVVSTASAASDSLVVSLHDVAPSNRETAQKIISELANHGVRVCSLLVVPDYHHQGSAMEDRQFLSWLRQLESQGHEIVIHGYFHERPRRQNETPGQKILTRFYTNDEGEFYDLDYEEALRRITAARDGFRSNGLTPRGFIAPAWLAWSGGGTSRLRRRDGIHHAVSHRARSSFSRRFPGLVDRLQCAQRMAEGDESGLERGLASPAERKAFGAVKHSSARLFLSGHLATDCRSYQGDGHSENTDHLSRLDRRAKDSGQTRILR